ncbi:MAG: DUF99 family protein [Candidatus Bathyarchaeales archaeon]
MGVEDGSFQKGITPKALLVAVLFKGLEIEDVKIVRITVDGLDATEKLVKILREWKFEAIMLAGISFAGFNVVDPTIIHKQFEKPVIVISRTKPNNKAVKQALQRHFEDWRVRWDVFEKLGLIHKVVASTGGPPVYVETVGVSAEWAGNLIRALSVYSRIPEPIRVARLIARGLS